MKKIKIVMTTMATLFLLMTTLPAYSTPMVRLEVAPVVSVGSTFSLGVFIDGVTGTDPILGTDEILAFGFDIAADSGLIYNGAIFGTGFFDDSLLFSDTEVAGSALPGVSGDNIELATLSFTATVAGDFTLGILSDLSNFNQGLHTLLLPTPLNISLTKNITAVPEPGLTSLMFAGILSGIGMTVIETCRKKKAGMRI